MKRMKFRHLMVFGIAILISMLVVVTSCTKKDDDSKTKEPTAGEKKDTLEETASQNETVAEEPSSECDDSEKYDGVYSLVFESEGNKTSIGAFEVRNSQFSGDAVNVFKQKFEIEGCVISSTGTLVFTNLASSDGIGVSASGAIYKDGIAEGEFTVGNRQGTFSGSLNNASLENEETTEFDGLSFWDKFSSFQILD